MKTKTHQDLCWHLPLLASAFACGSIYSAVADSFYGFHIAQRYGPDFSGNTQSIASATDIE